MKTIYRIIIVFGAMLLLLPGKSVAVGFALSEASEITLLTASPGDELYSVFGHSALRVKDPANQTDLVFNYGTFDFDTPNFYLEFTRGKLMYKLSVVPMEFFMREYTYEGRAVFEQKLNLSQTQKQRMFNFLMINRLPENAYYHYDFFYDNCATRIRDLVDELIQPVWPDHAGLTPEIMADIRSQLQYEFEYVPDYSPHRSFRDLLQPFLVNMPWSAFGIDLALGLPADAVATPADFMFLPDEMLIAFALAHHQDGSPLVSEHRIVLHKAVELPPASPFRPQLVFWAIFVLGVISLLSRAWSRIFDKVFFSMLGITGLVVVFLWFFTDHMATKGNLNILWALPTHLYFIWSTRYDDTRFVRVLYFRLTAILGLLLLLSWPWMPQAYHAAFFPIICTSLLKSLFYTQLSPFTQFWNKKL